MTLSLLQLSTRNFRLPLILAHRGASGHAPENTITAFKLARELGADGAELDVRLTADGVPVVFHDDGLRRLFGASSRVGDLTLSALRRHRFGKKFGPRYDDELIPTLDEALDALDGLVVNIELKCDGLPRGGIGTKVASIIRTHSAADRVVVSSFNPILLALFKAASRDISTAFLFDPEGRPGLRGPWAGCALRTDYLNPRHDCVTAARTAAWHRRGYGVMTWTVNDEAGMRRAAGCGVDAIITNYPDRMRAVLAQS